MTEPTLLIAFGIGLLSFLAPCTLPVLPGYFSYLAGVSQEENGYRKRFKVFVASLAFVSGFLLVLIILGAAASAAGQFLLGNRLRWQKIGGILVIVFGLQTIGLLKLGFLQKGKEWHLEKFASWKHGKAFLAGSGFGLGWTPCIGPILGSILILASQTQTLTRGIELLISYALGLAIPMLLSGLFVSQLKFLRSQYVSAVSGVVLITLGFLLFFDQYSKLTIWTARVYESLQIPIF